MTNSRRDSQGLTHKNVLDTKESVPALKLFLFETLNVAFVKVQLYLALFIISGRC